MYIICHIISYISVEAETPTTQICELTNIEVIGEPINIHVLMVKKEGKSMAENNILKRSFSKFMPSGHKSPVQFSVNCSENNYKTKVNLGT